MRRTVWSTPRVPLACAVGVCSVCCGRGSGRAPRAWPRGATTVVCHGRHVRMHVPLACSAGVVAGGRRLVRAQRTWPWACAVGVAVGVHRVRGYGRGRRHSRGRAPRVWPWACAATVAVGMCRRSACTACVAKGGHRGHHVRGCGSGHALWACAVGVAAGVHRAYRVSRRGAALHACAAGTVCSALRALNHVPHAAYSAPQSPHRMLRTTCLRRRRRVRVPRVLQAWPQARPRVWPHAGDTGMAACLYRVLRTAGVACGWLAAQNMRRGGGGLGVGVGAHPFTARGLLLYPPSHTQSPILAAELSRVSGGIPAASLSPADRVSRFALEIEALQRVLQDHEHGAGVAEGEDPDEHAGRNYEGVLLRRISDFFLYSKLILSPARGLAAAVSDAMDVEGAAQRSPADTPFAEDAWEPFECEPELSVKVVASTPIAALPRVSLLETRAPLFVPGTVGASSAGAVLAFVTGCPAFAAPGPLSHLLSRLAGFRFTADPTPTPSSWVRSCPIAASVEGKNAATATLSAFTASTFCPHPSTLHDMFSLIQGAFPNDGAGAAGAGAAGASRHEGGEWYGGSLVVPPSATTLRDIVRLCGDSTWTGLVLALRSEMDVHYVAFCNTSPIAANPQWNYADPDVGVATATLTGFPLTLPRAVSNTSLTRTLYRFNMGNRPREENCKTFWQFPLQ